MLIHDILREFPQNNHARIGMVGHMPVLIDAELWDGGIETIEVDGVEVTTNAMTMTFNAYRPKEWKDADGVFGEYHAGYIHTVGRSYKVRFPRCASEARYFYKKWKKAQCA